MVVGIAYHSPVDVSALLPLGVRVTLDPRRSDADVLFSRDVVTTSICHQIVFASDRALSKHGISAIDQGEHGSIASISHEMFEFLSNSVGGTT
jgi:hypothetical protein